MVNSVSPPQRLRRAPIGAHLAAIFGVCLLSLAVIIGYSGRSAFVRERARAAEQVGSTAQFAAAGLASQLASLPTFLEAIATQPAVLTFDATQCDSALAGYRHFGLGFVSVVRADGSVVCTSAPTTDLTATYSGTAWFAGIAAGRDMDGTVVTSSVSNKPAFVESTPLKGAGGQQGWMVALLDPEFLSLGAQAPLQNSDTQLLVLDPARKVVLSASGSDSPYIGTALSGSPLSHALSASSLTGPDGVNRIYAESGVARVGWHVVAGVPTSKALAAAWTELWRNLVLGGLSVAVVAALGLLLRRRVVRPIRSLTAAIERAGRGEDSPSVAVDGPAELVRVAEAFNHMVKERQEFESYLAHQASHDSLTGLPNRAALLAALSHALEVHRPRSSGAVVAFLDLDRFKLINDTHGHPTGDKLLVALADRVRSVLRPAEMVARFGGDEFVVLAAESDGAPEELAQRLVGALRHPFDLDDLEIFLSGSVGVAVAGQQSSAEDLLAEADAAMYRAKDLGHDFALYDAEMRSSAANRLGIEAGLHRALERNELELYYQPVVRVSDRTMVGVEALLRWHRPEHGMCPPAEFIPVAEQTGLILPIGAWVLESACKQAAAWRQEFLGVAPRVSVNVSVRQLAQAGFVDQVRSVLDRTGLPADGLCIEITESALVDDIGGAQAVLTELRALGITVSVDDFGTGYSSLSYLQRYPVDELKVDRSFVSRLDPAAGGSAIVRSIVELAHSLRMTVVAEGVEATEHLLALRRMGCDLAQGYFFSRPVPAAEVESLIREAIAPLTAAV